METKQSTIKHLLIVETDKDSGKKRRVSRPLSKSTIPKSVLLVFPFNCYTCNLISCYSYQRVFVIIYTYVWLYQILMKSAISQNILIKLYTYI